MAMNLIQRIENFTALLTPEEREELKLHIEDLKEMAAKDEGRADFIRSLSMLGAKVASVRILKTHLLLEELLDIDKEHLEKRGR